MAVPGLKATLVISLLRFSHVVNVSNLNEIALLKIVQNGLLPSTLQALAIPNVIYQLQTSGGTASHPSQLDAD